MNILLLLSRIDQTGMTTNTLDLGLALQKKGHQITILSGGKAYLNHPGINELDTKFKNAGFILKEIPITSFVGFKNKIKNFYSVIKIVCYILKMNPDIIHVESPYLSFIPWLIGRRFTSTIHVTDLYPTFFYKKATKVIPISKETADWGIDILKYKKDDIRMVYNGVDKRFSIKHPEFDETDFKQKNEIPLDKIIIGFVGSIEYRKGHDILLKSIALLEEELRNKIHVILIGDSKDGKTYDWLNNLIIQTNTKNIVSVFRYQDPKPFYDIIDIFVLPSRKEGCPVVIPEAMLSDCCVVRSNTEGSYDQITHGQDGFLFENEDYHGLQSLLIDLLENPDKIRQLKNAAKEKALNNFTSEIMAEKSLEVYQEIIDL